MSAPLIAIPGPLTYFDIARGPMVPMAFHDAPCDVRPAQCSPLGFLYFLSSYANRNEYVEKVHTQNYNLLPTNTSSTTRIGINAFSSNVQIDPAHGIPSHRIQYTTSGSILLDELKENIITTTLEWNIAGHQLALEHIFVSKTTSPKMSAGSVEMHLHGITPQLLRMFISARQMEHPLWGDISALDDQLMYSSRFALEHFAQAAHQCIPVDRRPFDMQMLTDVSTEHDIPQIARIRADGSIQFEDEHAAWRDPIGWKLHVTTRRPRIFDNARVDAKTTIAFQPSLRNGLSIGIWAALNAVGARPPTPFDTLLQPLLLAFMRSSSMLLPIKTDGWLTQLYAPNAHLMHSPQTPVLSPHIH